MRLDIQHKDHWQPSPLTSKIGEFKVPPMKLLQNIQQACLLTKASQHIIGNL
jgi:hypothetical protein